MASAQTAMLSTNHVAELLDVSERTVRRWAAEGRLDRRRIGPRTVRVTEASVLALLDEADGQHDQDQENRAA